MYYPSKSEFIKLARQGNIIPVYTEIVSDIETPVSAFLKISDDSDYSYLLESVEGEERIARYSFLSASPLKVLRFNSEDPLSEIKKFMKQHKAVHTKNSPRFCGGFVGYIGYETVRHFEDIPVRHTDSLGLPDSVFLLTDTLIVFDHIHHKMQLVSNTDLTSDSINVAYSKAIKKIDALSDKLSRKIQCQSFKAMSEAPSLSIDNERLSSNTTKNEFKDMVLKAKRYIKEGDIIQAVLSHRMRIKPGNNNFNIYRALRVMNPSPYMYYLKLKDFSVIGSSPEMMARCQDNLVEVRPIAGTRHRGCNEQEDAMLAYKLKNSAKERAEHLMLVDLARNDIGRVCRQGSIKVKDFMTIEKYSHVMHLVSNVSGALRQDKDSYDVFRATFPAGTVTGAPKVRAMEIITELEKAKRGIYAGCVGYFSFSGNMDTCIAIRTIIAKDGLAYVQAGAGIVADSNPDREYEETINKAAGCLKAIKMARRF